jgi:tRNA pseudouridine55 synthase
MEESNDLEGVLPIDKPEGPTSHDIVASARRSLGLRRIGHTGTLDPFASGLLLLVLGRATRLAEFFSPLSKQYHAVLRLGLATASDDRTGVPIATSESWRDLEPDTVREVLARQTETTLQLPPAISAKKVAGERAYAAARRGTPLVLSPVPVAIYRIEVLRVALPDVEFWIECSAGTYIRALARDVGNALGVHAHLHALRRIGIGGFRVEGSLSPQQLTVERARAACIAPLDALPHLERVDIDAATARTLVMGGSVPAPPGLAGVQPIAVAHEGHLVAIADPVDGRLRPRKVFADA